MFIQSAVTTKTYNCLIGNTFFHQTKFIRKLFMLEKIEFHICHSKWNFINMLTYENVFNKAAKQMI